MIAEQTAITRYSVYPWVFEGEAKASNYTITADDYAVGVNTAGGSVTVTIPDASTITKYPRTWLIKKMSNDVNDLIIVLAVPADSMFGEQFYAIRLTVQGQGLDVLLNANGKYTFTEASGLQAEYLFSPEVSTTKPSLSSTTLTLNGNIDSLGAEASLNARFRYRDVTDDDPWTETSDASKSATGSYTDTATVTAAHEYAVQAILETAAGAIYYGGVLHASLDYYYDAGEASADGLERYWPMQETTGTDTTAVETFGKDMTMYNGVTVGSDSIDGNTIYKRIFGPADYGEADLGGDLGEHSHTILIQVDMDSTSGDHTIFSFGRNILSIASDNTGIQLNVNGYKDTWSSATPFADVLNLFVVNDIVQNRCTLYSCTSSARTTRIQRLDSASGIVPYFRIARGASGDSNHQDYEYMNNGTVRSCAIWHSHLTEAAMISICGVLDDVGGLIVS